jgi:hypothetical protein
MRCVVVGVRIFGSMVTTLGPQVGAQKPALMVAALGPQVHPRVGAKKSVLLVFFWIDIRFRWYSAPLHRVTAATLNLRFWVGVLVLLLDCLRARPELYLIQLCVDACWPHP